jgi:hypothetical protein
MVDSNGQLVTLTLIRAQVFLWLLRQVILVPRLQRAVFFRVRVGVDHESQESSFLVAHEGIGTLEELGIAFLVD